MKRRFFLRYGFLSVLLTFSLSITVWGEVAPPAPDSSWLTAMKVPDVPDGIDGTGVSVAIVDDSIYMEHPWYKNNLTSGITVSGELTGDGTTVKYDITVTQTDGSNPTDSSQGHGTNTTGCVYQVATGSSLIGIKNTDLSILTVPYAINYAVDNGAAIISNSYGMTVGYSGMYSAIGSYEDNIQSIYGFSETGATAINFSAAFKQANDAGAVILFSAGNNRMYNGVTSGSTTYLNSQDANKLAYQASPQTITVAAMDTDSTANASFSCYGASIFVAAPGQWITTSNYDYDTSAEGTATVNGTSFSCPFTAGCLALATQASEQAGAAMSSRLAKHLLVETSQKVDTTNNTGWDGMDARKTWVTNGAGNMFSHTYGFGMVDAEALVEMASEGYAVTEQTYLSIYHYAGETTTDYSTQAEEVYFSGLTFSTNTDGLATFSTEGTIQDVALSTMDATSLTINDTASLPGDSRLVVSAAGDAKVVVGDAEVSAGSGALVQTLSFTIDETFTEVDFQALEEVALTLAISGTLGAMEVIVTHTGTQDDGSEYSTSSILAFAQENDSLLSDTQDGIIWTFSSNAFWGEDVAGDWTIDIYDMYVAATDLSDLVYYGSIMSYSMGEMYAIPAGADVPEPSTWILLVCFGGWFVAYVGRRKMSAARAG
ncbi:MAG: S8 family serine peptidase [Planctomycetia bacterium]|nr:S8 family serine peptidase [Planctomycetia bacterium]